MIENIILEVTEKTLKKEWARRKSSHRALMKTELAAIIARLLFGNEFPQVNLSSNDAQARQFVNSPAIPASEFEASMEWLCLCFETWTNILRNVANPCTGEVTCFAPVWVTNTLLEADRNQYLRKPDEAKERLRARITRSVKGTVKKNLCASLGSFAELDDFDDMDD